MSDSEEGTRPKLSARPQMRNPLEDAQDKPKGDTTGLASLFKGREAPYTSVLKSLEQIGLEPRMMDIMIGDEPVSCFVIPVQDLVFKEWQRMSGANYEPKMIGEES